MAFICTQSNYVDNAVRWVSGIEDLVNSLGFMPQRFQIAEELVQNPIGIRQVVYHAHLILFAIYEDEKVVRVLRVLHTRLDRKDTIEIENLLGDDSP